MCLKRTAASHRRRTSLNEPPICTNRDCSRIQSEIRTALTGASEVHSALCVPEFHRVNGFDVAARIIPHRHVGGDFVCKVESGNTTVLVLGDLMGKGLSAAMWITHILDLVHRAAERFSSLGAMMTKLNAEIMQSRVRAPLTSAIAIALEAGSRQVTCTCAGHPPAVVVRRDGTREILCEGGPLLGVFPDAHYVARRVELANSDALVAFSDGISEAEGESEEQFSPTRVAVAVAEHAGESALGRLTAVLEASKSFRGEKVTDDVSALVIQPA